MSFSVAYSMKRKKCHGGKMADGGTVQPTKPQSGPVSPDEAEKFRKGAGFAKGGYASPEINSEGVHYAPKGSGESDVGFMSKHAKAMHPNNPAKNEVMETAKARHRKVLGALRAMPNPKLEAEGGMIECDESCNHPCEVHENDMVDRIMVKRMSKGGEVANEDMPEADFMQNEFDDLHLRDGLEFSETDANSGDELGDAGEDERRKDRVMRIMMKRTKDSNPRPA